MSYCLPPEVVRGHLNPRACRVFVLTDQCGYEHLLNPLTSGKNIATQPPILRKSSFELS